MTRTLLALFAFATLSSGCVKPLVIPSQAIPHRLSRDTTARIWVRAPDGKMTEVKVKVPEGWWVAGPLVVGE